MAETTDSTCVVDDALLDRFERWGFDTRTWTQGTRKQYRRHVRRADRWTHRTAERCLPDADTALLTGYLSTLSTNPSTRNNTRSGLVAFFDWLAADGQRDDNPAEPLPRLRRRRPVPKAMTAGAAHAVLRAAYAEGPMWVGLMTVLLFQGLRATAARTLRWDQLDDGWMILTSKGGYERILPVHPEVQRALSGWRHYCSSLEWVFPSPRQPGPISAAWLKRIVGRIGDAAGVTGLHPHMCRHTAATRLLEQGASLREVQEFLGHVNIENTARYTRVRPKQLVECVRRLDYEDAS